MEEFARGFPNRHTAHRDTSVYLYANVFEGQQGGWIGKRNREARGGKGERCAEGTVVRCEAIPRSQASSSASASYTRGLCVCVPIHIYIHIRSVKHARADVCAGR